MELDKTNDCNTTIGVVGLGYVGLPAMHSFHEVGYNVIGIDVSEKKIDLLNRGINPLSDTTDSSSIPLESKRWSISSNFEDSINKCDIIIIAVPTPVSDKKPDLNYIKKATKSILENLNLERRTIVILESTVYPGITRDLLINKAKELELSDEEVAFAYCPERVSPGESNRTVNNTARVIGSDSEEIGQYVTNMYSKITNQECRYVGKPEVAEAAKLIENVQRDIDIAFVNELATVLPKIGLDVKEVLDAASTKWNFHKHDPGIGVGGHCIPVDPYYYISLSEKLGINTLMSTSARKVNENMPKFASEIILDKLKDYDKRKILILGYSYKPELGDIRETPVRELCKNLYHGGCQIFIKDPHVSPTEIPEWANYVSKEDEGIIFDLIVMATGHSEFNSLNWGELLTKCRTKIIYDGRRFLEREKMEKIGWIYHGIGVAE
jgi:UDP-N-acetyl-D-glucosamine/UDP-N-acetyl-D-galactosamine dehydrogenase